MGAHGQQRHDGLAVASLVSLLFMPLLALILGAISIGMAHQEGRKASWMAVLAVWASSIGFVIAVILMAVIVMQH